MSPLRHPHVRFRDSLLQSIAAVTDPRALTPSVLSKLMTSQADAAQWDQVEYSLIIAKVSPPPPAPPRQQRRPGRRRRGAEGRGL